MSKIETEIQATLCSVNTKIGTSKVSEKKFCMSIGNIGGTGNHTFVRAMMTTKATTLTGTGRSDSRIIVVKGLYSYN